MLACDMAFELEQIPALKAAIELCEKEQDYISRELLEEILEYEEEYVDWIEAQQFLIQHTGIQNYLQSQVEE
jgi:bacterioferritin